MQIAIMKEKQTRILLYVKTCSLCSNTILYPLAHLIVLHPYELLVIIILLNDPEAFQREAKQHAQGYSTQ